MDFLMSFYLCLECGCAVVPMVKLKITTPFEPLPSLWILRIKLWSTGIEAMPPLPTKPSHPPTL